MATFQVTGGALEGHIIVYPGGPDNSLPGYPPYVSGGPIIPPAPPVIWPPPPRGEVTPPIYLPPVHVGGGPMPGGPHPDQGLPGSQPHPDQGLPGSPPAPDQGLPGQPPRPDQGLPPSGEHPDQGLPIPPGIIWPPAGPGASGKYLALVVVAVGSTGQITYAWTVVDPSLTVGWPLPGAPVAPSHPIDPGGVPTPRG